MGRRLGAPLSQTAVARASRAYVLRGGERVRRLRRENHRKWVAANRGRMRELTNASYHRRRAADLEKFRHRAFHAELRRVYGPTGSALVTALWDAQLGRCAVCACALAPLGTHYTHVDHDHCTGVLRGILCRGCNVGIGHFEDSPERLRGAAAYLENSDGLPR